MIPFAHNGLFSASSDPRSPSQKPIRLTELRDFRTIYAQKEERISGTFSEDWPLHLRQFVAICGYDNIPDEDRGHLLLLSLRRRAGHFFMETADDLLGGKRNWEATTASLKIHYASFTRQEEASRSRITSCLRNLRQSRRTTAPPSMC